jgi:hypothetical protein
MRLLPPPSVAAYRIGEDQVRMSLQCEISPLLTAAVVISSLAKLLDRRAFGRDRPESGREFNEWIQRLSTINVA